MESLKWWHPKMCQKFMVYTLTEHFIRNTILILCMASIVCGMDSTRCWDSVPCWHDCITQPLQICQIQIHAANLPFCHIPKGWIQIRWMGRPLKNIELIVMFMKPVWDVLSFMTWCIIMLVVAIRRWVHYGHERIHMVSNNAQIGCSCHILSPVWFCFLSHVYYY